MISTQYVLVLLLGVGRWAILKLLNYQEHVSEYGVHWNFFVTLFCVWTVADTMHHTIPRQFLVWIALIWLIAYQTLLVSTSLTDYLLSNVRTNIISANKEGIFSLLGYVPMYLLSESFSFNICFNRGHFHNSNTTSSSSSSSSNGDGGASVTSSMNTAAATASAQLEGGGSVNNINCDEFDINTVLIPGADDVTVTMDNNQAGTAEFDINNHATVLKEGRSHLGGNDSSLNIEVAKLSATAPGTGQPMRVIRWNRVLIWKLAISASVLWVAWLAGASVQPTSRRLVNLTYVALVLALTMSLLLMLYIIDNVSYGPAVCVLTLQYMSKHSLVVFLSANVLTGAVNMTLKTIYASRGTAIAVLSVYTLALTGIAYLAEYFSSHYKALKLR